MRGEEKPYIIVTVYFDRRLRGGIGKEKDRFKYGKNQNKDMPVISVGIPEELKKEIEEFMREEGPEESAVLRNCLLYTSPSPRD